MTSPSESQVYYNTLHTEHQEMNVLTGEFDDNKQTEIENLIVLIERNLLYASNISNEPSPRHVKELLSLISTFGFSSWSTSQLVDFPRFG